MKNAVFFLGSFISVLLACLAGWWLFTAGVDTREGPLAPADHGNILNLEIPNEFLTEARSGDPVIPVEVLGTEAIVVLLGGIGCSRDQVEVLRRWQEPEDSIKTVVGLYADPLMGIERSRYESLVLRRASGVQFPMLVYEGQQFSLRGLGMITPQVVRIRDGRIVELLPPMGN